MERKFTRRELFKAFVPASLITPRFHDRLEPCKDVEQFLHPDQYTQEEFNQLTALSFSTTFESLRNLNGKVRDIEERLPRWTPLPDDGQI